MLAVLSASFALGSYVPPTVAGACDAQGSTLTPLEGFKSLLAGDAVVGASGCKIALGGRSAKADCILAHWVAPGSISTSVELQCREIDRLSCALGTYRSNDNVWHAEPDSQGDYEYMMRDMDQTVALPTGTALYFRKIVASEPHEGTAVHVADGTCAVRVEVSPNNGAVFVAVAVGASSSKFFYHTPEQRMRVQLGEYTGPAIVKEVKEVDNSPRVHTFSITMAYKQKLDMQSQKVVHRLMCYAVSLTECIWEENDEGTYTMSKSLLTMREADKALEVTSVPSFKDDLATALVRTNCTYVSGERFQRGGLTEVSSKVSQDGKEGSNLVLIIATSVVCVIALAICICAFVVVKKKKNHAAQVGASVAPARGVAGEAGVVSASNGVKPSKSAEGELAALSVSKPAKSFAKPKSCVTSEPVSASRTRSFVGESTSRPARSAAGMNASRVPREGERAGRGRNAQRTDRPRGESRYQGRKNTQSLVMN